MVVLNFLNMGGGKRGISRQQEARMCVLRKEWP
jgi:hypothetical protein